MDADGSNQTRLTNNPALDWFPSWSPDGTRIAFTSGRDGNSEIYVMDADGSNQTRLTNNPALDWFPSWSPDGSRIAFESERDGNFEIYVMSADGSLQTRLTDNPEDDTEPLWSPDGTKVAFQHSEGSYPFQVPDIYVMDADGSNQVQLTSGCDYVDHVPNCFISDLSWSLDGRRIAFASGRVGSHLLYDIYVMDADGSNLTRLTPFGVYDHQPALSPDGKRIAFESVREYNRPDPGSSTDIWVMDADGSNQTQLTDDPAWEHNPSWSPDGTKIAFARSRGSGPDFTEEVWVMDADGSNQVQLTSGDHYTMWCNYSPSWSPDGKRIAFASGGFASFASQEIWVMDADGSNRTRLTDNALWDGEPAWSPDGKRFAFASAHEYDHHFNMDIWVMSADGSSQKRLTDDPAYDRNPSWSPDGTKIAFEHQVEKISDNVWTTEPAEIWVMDADGSNLTQLTDNTYDDTEPAWGPSAGAPPSPTVPGTPESTPIPQVTMSFPARAPMEIRATPVESTYLSGEPVIIEFFFKNVGMEPVPILVPVRVWPFPPEIQVIRREPSWKTVRSFPPGSGQVNLDPGETATYTLVWDQKDDSGQQVDPGYYYINARDVHIEDTEEGRTWGTTGTVAKVLIQ